MNECIRNLLNKLIWDSSSDFSVKLVAAESDGAGFDVPAQILFLAWPGLGNLACDVSLWQEILTA